jgi:hypothetical protein
MRVKVVPIDKYGNASDKHRKKSFKSGNRYFLGGKEFDESGLLKISEYLRAIFKPQKFFFVFFLYICLSLKIIKTSN